MITADFETLLRQASMTAHDYMFNAKRSIDDLFGEGYAAKNPALVAAFMQTAAADFTAGSNAKVFGAALEGLATGITELATAIQERTA